MEDVAPGTAEEAETYNPWSIVNLVFHHLAEKGLHPVLGGSGDPGPPAAELLLALGIAPAFVSLLIESGAAPPTVAELLYAVNTKDRRGR